MSKNATGKGIDDPKEFTQRPAAAIPDFNPYDAVGIPTAAYTTEQLGQRFRRAHSHLLRAMATASAPAFPTRADINSARDYLREVTAKAPERQRGCYRRWEGKPRTFFGELEIGAPGVFVPRAATPPRATPTPTRGPSRPAPAPRQRRPAREEDDDPFYTPPPRPSRPPPRRRDRDHHERRRSDSPVRSPPRTRSHSRAGATPTPGATPASATPTGATPSSDRTGDFSGYTRRERTPPPGTSTSSRDGDRSGYTRRERTPPLGATAQNPHTITSDDSDVSDHAPPTPSPAPPPPGGGGGRENIFQSRGSHGMFGASARPRPPRPPGPPPPPPRRQTAPPPTPRSGGGGGSGTPPLPTMGSRSAGSPGMRMAPVENPVLGDEVVVGTWAHAPLGGGAIPNAVVAVFDRRGRLNFRIVARTIGGNAVPAPNGTSVALSSINLRWPYAGWDPTRLRAMIDQHIRLPRNQRP